jgi:DNA-binding YbaB/EbfC family protein
LSTLDLGKLFEQAQQLQRRLADAQGELAKRTVTAESGGGLVSVTANGLLEVVAIKLDPVCVDNRDVKMLEDLVLLATNKALREARALAEAELGGLAGGLRP